MPRNFFKKNPDPNLDPGLVELMQYLFMRILKARGLAHNESPYVKIKTMNHYVKSKPASHRPGESTDLPDWHQVFAIAHNRPDSASTTLEISVWDLHSENFLGGVCFDLFDVPVRDPLDSPLAPQWYRLEGGPPINIPVESPVTFSSLFGLALKPTMHSQKLGTQTRRT